ncbi:galactose-binding like [Fusarium sp. NRRL 52700]|nr:galactose-binding like [Fusarium sp. NRRL 52700]
MPPIERGWITFFVDRIFGWWSGLPRETSSYTTEFIQIPVNDVKLAANLYQPTSPPRGTILIRTSYGIAPLMALGNARMFASRGYQVLLAACRGTDPSDGQELVPAVYEAQDGLATVAWMREQPWYTGSFATYGGSYLGHTQWAILTDPPEDMKAAVISTGPVDFGSFTWGTGAMETHMIAWAALMTAPKRGITPGLPYIRKLPTVLQPVYDSLPLMDVEQGAPAFLTIGPWSHLGSQRGPTLIEALQFFDHYLAGQASAPRTSPCRVFVTGSNEWRDLPNWPPLASSTLSLYLSPRTLSKVQPEQASSSSFTFNPNNATPAIGMPRPFDDVQPTNYNDTELANRSDVVVFDTPPLESDVEVCGKPSIELHHNTDNPHADILVRLSEVNSKGKFRRISDVYKRLDPARGPEPLSLALVDCAHVFRKGSKIRVIIAGGAHPAYLRNLGTGENQAYGTRTEPAVHTIHHSKDAVSRLTLPVTA